MGELHPEDVKASIRKRGSSLAQIGRELGVSVQAVSAVLHGVTRSERIEEALAKASGYPLELIRELTRAEGTRASGVSQRRGAVYPAVYPRNRGTGATEGAQDEGGVS